ncbi:MAG TPA: hypothetical protein VIV60_05310, partial [Polyangiaceae bacterium]
GNRQDAIKLLLQQCAACRSQFGAPVIVIDECDHLVPQFGDICRLARVATTTDSFRLVLIGQSAFVTHLTSALPIESASFGSVLLRQLNPNEVRQYLVARVTSCQGLAGRPILWTPDAVLILTHLGQGDLRRLNELAISTLRDAAERRRQIVDSWDVWDLQDDIDGEGHRSKPPDWPLPEVLELLNDLRRHAGLPVRGGT